MPCSCIALASCTGCAAASWTIGPACSSASSARTATASALAAPGRTGLGPCPCCWQPEICEDCHCPCFFLCPYPCLCWCWQGSLLGVPSLAGLSVCPAELAGLLAAASRHSRCRVGCLTLLSICCCASAGAALRQLEMLAQNQLQERVLAAMPTCPHTHLYSLRPSQLQVVPVPCAVPRRCGAERRQRAAALQSQSLAAPAQLHGPCPGHRGAEHQT